MTMDLLDAAAYHQLALQAERRSPDTLQLYLIYERRFLEYLDERRIAPTLDALNPVNVRQALEWFAAKPHAGSRGGEATARAFVRTLKTWANFLAAEEIYVDSPLHRVKSPRVAKLLRQPYIAQELMALWAAARQTRTPERDEALLLVLLDTGMRIGEACTLTLDKLQLQQGRVVVGEHGKSRRERLVPIGDPTKPDGGRAVRALRAWLVRREILARRRPERAVDRLFLTVQGYPLTADGGTDVVKALGARAGVQNAIPHRLRHTFATHFLTVFPGDELGLRRILGHVSLEVMADYVHLAQTTVADRAGRASLAETLTAPKQDPRPQQRRHEPLLSSWGIGPPSTPAPKPKPLSERLEELLVGIQRDPALRRALLRALREDAA